MSTHRDGQKHMMGGAEAPGRRRRRSPIARRAARARERRRTRRRRGRRTAPRRCRRRSRTSTTSRTSTSTSSSPTCMVHHAVRERDALGVPWRGQAAVRAMMRLLCHGARVLTASRWHLRLSRRMALLRAATPLTVRCCTPRTTRRARRRRRGRSSPWSSALPGRRSCCTTSRPTTSRPPGLFAAMVSMPRTYTCEAQAATSPLRERPSA